MGTFGKNTHIFYLKTGFPFFWACDGNLIWKRNFRIFLAFLENNANIFYLKTGFPCFFGLWWEPLEKMPISSIWKRDFLFFWACDGNLWKIMPISSIWKRDFGFFLACDGNLWKIISISSIWKRNFRVLSGFVMGTSFENGISVFFLSFLENNANIFYLETGSSCFFSLWWEPLGKY